MPVDDRVARSVRARLTTCGHDEGDRLVVMHVSAGNPFRRWPIASFGDVAAALASSARRVRVIVTSGPSERDAASHVIAHAQARLPEADRACVLDCGEFSLAELRALADRAALYIGGDSGPMHIAATSRVPMVSLYGPTLPVRSAPWRAETIPVAPVEVSGLPCRPCDQRVCEPGDFRCLGLITPEQVIAEAVRLLAWNG